uniref:HTH psq-type domain-containing protein n=1 Tax=Phytophthora ramorum TaxID=164328 RepID=H3GYX1_PHYRM
MSRRKQKIYTVKEKQAAVLLAQEVGVKEAARVLGYPRGFVFSWNKQAESLFDFHGPKTTKPLKALGRKEIFPSVSAVVTSTKDVRRDEKVISTNAVINQMCT